MAPDANWRSTVSAAPERPPVNCGGDPEGKFHLMLEYAGRAGDVAGPWYTGDFEATWRDVLAGCEGFLKRLKG